MGFFVRAVVSGFGFTLGAALFKKVQGHLGLEDPKDKDSSEVQPGRPEPTPDPQPQS